MNVPLYFLRWAPALAGAALFAVALLAATPARAGDEMIRNAQGEYILPPLPYAYNALEPYLDETTMRLHHDKHHLAYVNGLNAALTGLAQARESGNYDLVQYYTSQVAFHGAGHFMHSLFWQNMSPNGGGLPKSELLAAIEKDFGSFDRFKAQFSAAAAKVEGSGWAELAWQPEGRQLLIMQVEKHQNLSPSGLIPLLVLDVWEHAYYLKYQNRRADYVAAFFNVINWDDVSRRYESAK